MSLSTRLGALEENLSPREAVALWMRESHEFGSYAAYGRWLLAQPEQAYPLIRMPRQVVAAVRARNKGRPDRDLQADFLRAEKEVIFLYFLHKELNLRLYLAQEALQVRALLLFEKLRVLIYEKHERDDLRLARLDLETKRRSRPTPKETKLTARLQRERAEFEEALSAFTRRLLGLGELERSLSARYFFGEELLYPDCSDLLATNLGLARELRDIYRDAVSFGAPEDEAGFRAYALWLGTDGEVGSPPPEPPDEEEENDLSAAGEARVLLRQVVLSAKVATLEKLGEQGAAEALAEDLLRKEWEGEPA